LGEDYEISFTTDDFLEIVRIIPYSSLPALEKPNRVCVINLKLSDLLPRKTSSTPFSGEDKGKGLTVSFTTDAPRVTIEIVVRVKINGFSMRPEQKTFYRPLNY